MLLRESVFRKLQTQLEDKSEAVVKLTALLESERDNHQAAIQHEEKLAKQLRRDVDQLRVSVLSSMTDYYMTTVCWLPKTVLLCCSITVIKCLMLSSNWLQIILWMWLSSDQ